MCGGDERLAQPGQVDLVADLVGEGLDRPLAVVACPVEAPVDGPLDATASRLEQRGRDDR